MFEPSAQADVFQDVFTPEQTTVYEWTLEGRPHENASVQRVRIANHPFTIGRNAENSLSLANSTVSSFHAELVMVDTDVFVRDLDSTNGTLLNGRPVQGVSGLVDGDILHFGNAMYTLQRRTGETDGPETVATDTAEDALGQIQFDKLLNSPAVRPDFQPIVWLQDHTCVAYEALSRSQLIGLETPAKMFRIASQRASSAQLSEVCRYEALRLASLLGYDKQYYLNTHPAEMNSQQLIDSLKTLRSSFPNLPVVLEVHEAAVTSVDYLRDLKAAMADLNIGLAYDDFGSGQARLMELSKVPPDVLKFDIGIIKELPTAGAHARGAVQALIKIAHDLGVICLAEGIETEEQAQICLEIGFELAQGFLFGRAERVNHWVAK